MNHLNIQNYDCVDSIGQCEQLSWNEIEQQEQQFLHFVLYVPHLAPFLKDVKSPKQWGRWMINEWKEGNKMEKWRTYKQTDIRKNRMEETKELTEKNTNRNKNKKNSKSRNLGKQAEQERLKLEKMNWMQKNNIIQCQEMFFRENLPSLPKSSTKEMKLLGFICFPKPCYSII